MKRRGIIILILLIFPLLLFSQPVLLNELFNQEGVSLVWDPYRKAGLLESPRRSIVFRPGLPWALGNHRIPLLSEVWLDDQGRVWLSGSTARGFKSYLAGEFETEEPIIAAVVIDAGHGGRDPGAVGQIRRGNGTIPIYEKTITLQVAQELGNLLRHDYPDRQILLTRTGDEYLTLDERTKIANSIELDPNEAMIFISLHANASFNSQARGFEVWYLPPDYRRDLLTEKDREGVDQDVLPLLNTMREEEFTQESIYLAKAISEGMAGELGSQSPNRGLKEESWFVVRDVKMPSVLVEVGFISNLEEAGRMAEAEYLKKTARGIYNGIKQFLEGFEKTKGFTE